MVQALDKQGPYAKYAVPDDADVYAKYAAPDPSLGDDIAAFGASVGAGTLESVGSGLEGLQSLANWIGVQTGLESGGGFGEMAAPLRSTASDLAQYAERTSPGFGNDIGQAIGSGIPYIAAAAATGGGSLLTGAAVEGAAAAGTAAVGILGAASQGQQDYERALRGGAGPEAARAAGLIGSLIGATEALPVWGVVGRLTARTGMSLERAAGIVTTGILENAAQEGVQTAGSNAAYKYLVDEDQKILDGVGKSMALGAIAGGIGAGAGVTVKHVADRIVSTEAPEYEDVPVPSEPESQMEPVSPPTDTKAEEPAKTEQAATIEPPQEATPGEPIVGGAGTAGGQSAAVPEAVQTSEAKQTGSDGAAPTQDLEQFDGNYSSGKSVSVNELATEQLPRNNSDGNYSSDLESLTGIKNAAVDRERLAMGLEPATHGEKTTFAADVQRARDALEADPTAGERLVNSLVDAPRTISSEEGALLAAEMVRIKNERNAARAAVDRARVEGTGLEAANARVKLATDAYLKAGEVATVVGTKQGQSLAFRRAMLKQDYSLAEMELAVIESKGGEALTEAESKEIQELHDKFQELEKQHGAALERIKALESENALKGVLPSIAARARRNRAIAAQRVRGPLRERITKGADEAREYFKTLGTRAHSGLPVDAIPHLIKLGAEVIANGTAEFEAWSKAVIEVVGERAAPHLKEAFDKAKELIKQLRLEYLTERVGERVSENKPIGKYAQSIAEHFVGEGVTEIDPLIDAVHGVLKTVDPKITREQARDAMSGYGQYRALSQDEIKRQLADLKQQAQKLAQIEALEKKLAPLKTGFERVEPSAQQRKLQKRVNELRKAAGITSTDPTRALKTALQSKETALRNRIADRRHEIDTGERIVKSSAPSPRNETTDALESELAALNAEHEAIFGKPGMSDEQRAKAAIKATERAIAENERRLATGDLAPTPETQGPPTEAMMKLEAERKALRARNTALRAEIESLRAASQQSGPSADELRLQRMIDEFGKRKERGQRQGPDTEAVTKLKAKLQELRDARELKDKQEREADRLAKRAERQATEPSGEEKRLQRQIDEFGKKRERQERQGPDTERVAKLKAKLEELRKAREDRERQTPEQIALKSAITRLRNRTAELMDRMARGDFGPKEKPRPTQLHPEVVKLAAENRKIRVQFERMKRHHADLNRTTTQRVKDSLNEIQALPRAVMTGYDVSAVLRQGGFLAFGSDPTRTASQAARMFKAMASEDEARRIDTEIRNHPGYELARASKLFLSDLDDELSPQEEAIRSRLSDKIPGIKPSNRAFVTFLNLQRFETFLRWTRALPITPTVEHGRDLAHAINVFTGRGEWKKLDPGMNLLAKVLWSPRLLLSRFQILAGEPIIRAKSKETKKLIAIQYGKTLAGLSSLYVIAAMAGLSIEGDPRSTGFGKITIGKTSIDPLLGVGQTATILAQSLPYIGGVKDRQTGNIKAVRFDDYMRFLRKKFAPALATYFDVKTGKNVVGDKVTPASAAVGLVTPLSFGTVLEAMKSEGVPTGLALGILSAFGMSVQTYSKDKK